MQIVTQGIALDIKKSSSANPRAAVNIARDNITPVCAKEVAFRMYFPPIMIKLLKANLSKYNNFT